MKKYKIFALIGKAASGKDTILQKVIAAAGRNGPFNEIISATTRPPRQEEVNGVNYHFLSIQEFGDKLLANEMLEVAEFNGWFYGTPLASLSADKINIGVFNPDGIYAMLENPDIDLKVYYIDVPDRNRLLRYLLRENDIDIDEMLRRYETDKKDFSYLDFNYTTLTNNSIYDRITNRYIAVGVEQAVNVILADAEDDKRKMD